MSERKDEGKSDRFIRLAVIPNEFVGEIKKIKHLLEGAKKEMENIKHLLKKVKGGIHYAG